MSRGLSNQQRQILAIALRVNSRTNGGQIAVKSDEVLNGYSFQAVTYSGVKDISWHLPAHIIKGVPFTQFRQDILKSNHIRQPAGGYFDLTKTAAMSAKASTVRAITSLLKSGYLAYAPKGRQHGYTLTAQGIDFALDQESLEFDDWLIWRSGLIFYPRGADDREFFDIADLMKSKQICIETLIKIERTAKYHRDAAEMAKKLSVTLQLISTER